MSLLSRLFGGGSTAPKEKDEPKAEPVEYKGFRIRPEPIPEGGQFRIAAMIEAEVAGETRSHHLVRADILRDRDEANEASVRKARQMIDEQDERLFG